MDSHVIVWKSEIYETMPKGLRCIDAILYEEF